MVNYVYFSLGVLWGFYSSVEPIFPFLGEVEFFLIKKILVKVHILRDPFHIAISLTTLNREAQDISFWSFLRTT